MGNRSVRRMFTRTLVAAVCLAGLAVAVPAIAKVTSPDMVVRPGAPDSFSLTSRDADGSVRDAVLSCVPLAGNHPASRAACRQLTGVRGQVSQIPPRHTLCTTEYDPVTVTAHGTWQGGPRTYSKEFSNRCTAVRDTGGVLFDF